METNVTQTKDDADQQTEQTQDQEKPAPHPMEEAERELSALLSKYDPVIGTLRLVKLLGVHRDELLVSIAEGMARAGRDQAVQIALTKSGKNRRQPTPANKATRKKKK